MTTEQVLAELAELEQGCDPELGWPSNAQAFGAQLAYQNAQRVVRDGRIAETAMAEAIANAIHQLEIHVAAAEASLGAGAFARGQKAAYVSALETVRTELADYLEVTR